MVQLGLPFLAIFIKSFLRHARGRAAWLVIIRNFHVVSVVTAPVKADSILIVDPNAVLALAITAQFFQPVSRRASQVVEIKRSVENCQFSPGNGGWRGTASFSAAPDFRRCPVGEVPDHELHNNTTRY